MKKKDAEKLVHIDPSMDDKIAAHAQDAFRELWDRTVDNATADPQSRLVTPTMAKEAIERRLRDVLGAGVQLPNVKVTINAARTGFDITITPHVEPCVVRQVH